MTVRATRNFVGAALLGAALAGWALVDGAVAQSYSPYEERYSPYNQRLREPGEPVPEYAVPRLTNPDVGRPAPTTPDLRVQGVRPMEGLSRSPLGGVGPAIEPWGSGKQADKSDASRATRAMRVPPRRPAFGQSTTGAEAGASQPATGGGAATGRRGPTRLSPP